MNDAPKKPTKRLTASQKSMLATMARRAWDRLSQAHAVDETFDDWRLRKCKRACGHRLSEAPMTAFDDLYIMFKAEAGDTDEAYERAASKVSNAVRNDIANIKFALAEVGWKEWYALVIARNEWESKLGLVIESLEQLPASVTRLLLYTVKARVRTEKKRRAARHSDR